MSDNTYHTAAVILRIKQLQTTDKLLICYSQEHGKIAVIAYGINKGKNRYSGLLQPFTNLQLFLKSGKRYETFRQAELIGTSLPAADLEFLSYACVICELAEEFTVDRQSDINLYNLLVDSLQLLHTRNKRLVTLIFICKLLVIAGVAPVYSGCVSCEKPLDSQAHFSPIKFGAVCTECKSSDDLPFAPETQELLANFTTMDLSGQIEFSIKGWQLLQLEQILYKLIYMHLDKPLKSLQYLAKLK